jgi:DNA-binding transcriptional ArsR family regulator
MPADHPIPSRAKEKTMANEDLARELRRIGQGKRGVEDAVSYAWGHRIRLEIVVALHDGPQSTDGLAGIVRKPISTVTHHVEELLQDGIIGIAKTERVGNLVQTYYRVIRKAEFSHEEVAAMTPEERHALFALVVHSATSEAMCSLRAGKMTNDPMIHLAWDRIDLDAKGREDLAAEQIRSWERTKEIACEAANRRAEAGEPGRSYIVTSFGYERSGIVAAGLQDDSLASGDD